jgi:hypothetical protein
MVLKTYDLNFSYDFSKGVGNRRSPKYVTPRTSVMKSPSLSSSFKQRKAQGKGNHYSKRTCSSTASTKCVSNTSNGMFFQDMPSSRRMSSYSSIDELNELDVSDFLQSDYSSSTYIDKFESLVDLESQMACYQIMPLFLTKFLLGFTKISDDLFVTMVKEVKRLKREKKLVPNTAAKAIRDSWQGEYGLALFCPLEERAFEPMQQNQDSPLIRHRSMLSESSATATTFDFHFESDDSIAEDDEEEEDDDDISIMFEENLDQNPRLLSQEQMKELQRHMPASVRLMTWARSYSLYRDGCDFHTMLRKCSMYSNTLVVIQTTQGDILGGFVDKSWHKQKQETICHRSRSFYGTGRCFLFASNPEGSNETEGIQAYEWTGENTYSQICDPDEGSLAMGGGGSFGWIIEDDFTRGSTGTSSTFNNPPLSKKAPGGTFEIRDVEIYGFKTMSEIFMNDSFSSLCSL